MINAYNVEQDKIQSEADAMSMTTIIIILVVIVVIIILVAVGLILSKLGKQKGWKKAILQREDTKILGTKRDDHGYSAQRNRALCSGSSFRGSGNDGAVTKTQVGPNRTRSRRGLEQNLGNEARAERIGPRAVKSGKKQTPFDRHSNRMEHVSKTRVGPSRGRGRRPEAKTNEISTQQHGEIRKSRIGPQVRRARGPMAQSAGQSDIARTSVGPRKRQQVATASVSKAHADEVSRTSVGPSRGRAKGRGQAKPRSVDAMHGQQPGEIARTNIGPRRNKQRGKAAAPATDAKQFGRSTYEADIAKTTVGPSRGRGKA